MRTLFFTLLSALLLATAAAWFATPDAQETPASPDVAKREPAPGPVATAIRLA